MWNSTEFTDFNPIWRDLFIEMLGELRFAVLVCDRLFGRIMEYSDEHEEDPVLKSAMIRLFEYNIPDLAVVIFLDICVFFYTLKVKKQILMRVFVRNCRLYYYSFKTS